MIVTCRYPQLFFLTDISSKRARGPYGNRLGGFSILVHIPIRFGSISHWYLLPGGTHILDLHF